LMAIAFRDAANGIAVGVEGTVLATGDGGASWEVMPKATNEHLFDLTWDGASWVAVGDKGELLKGDAQARQWQILRASANDRGWHTEIVSTSSHYLIAGENFAVIQR
ncbi:MAG: YCF48-related protein, partial [Noviherbaspirillum sp.]